MNQSQVKVIQSRLSSREKKLTLAQIRTHILTNYHDNELTEEQMSAIVEKLSGSTELAASSGELSNAIKQTLIGAVASTLDINLPIEQIRLINQKMDWAISDRSELKKRIKSAIVAWVDYQIEQDKQDTEEVLQEVEQHFINKLEQSNDHFSDRTQEFYERIGEARDNFRTSEKELLDLFKIPS